MKTKNIEENKINILKNEVCRGFYDACKDKSNLKVGLEIERLPIYKNNYEAVNYFGADGLYRLLRQIAYNDEWSYITDLNFINGLKKADDTITLEPGGQTEFSVAPVKNIADLKARVENLDKIVRPIADSLGILMLEYPITPVTDGREIEIIPKRRYQTMAKFMKGERCFSMMRETAGIQVSLDYTDEIDAMKKYRTAMMLSPFVTAMFANSPIRCGAVTGYKSTRALAWLRTDESRCGFVSQKIFNPQLQFSFADYVDAVLNVPVLFLQRDDAIVEIGGKFSFKTLLEKGYGDFVASKLDYDLHSTLFFPEVRLKNIIEIRNQDTQFGTMKYAIPSLYKGLLYNNRAMDNIFELLKSLTFLDFNNLRHNVPKYALNTKIRNKKVLDYAKIILEIAYSSLLEMKSGEESFLEPIMELVQDGLCPADLILREWKSSNKNIDKLVEMTRIK